MTSSEAQDSPQLPDSTSGIPEPSPEFAPAGGQSARQPGGVTALSAKEASPVKAPAGATRFDEVVTGQFDADEEDSRLESPKRVLAAQPETPKLHKILAQAGLGSRLEMEQLILEGRISVNAEPAHIGQRVQFGDTVKVNGKPIRVRIDPPPPRVIAYHKPVGEVVTHDDPQNRPTVFRRLPRLFQGKWQSVGRLDLNTEGLLLLTSSGELANKLMHPRFGLEREYAVRVLGALSNEEKKRLLDGVQLDDGAAQFTSIEAGGGEGANCWYKVTLSEGRNREVRRMFEAVGHAVSRLIRIRYGAMVLPRGLKRGAFVELDEREIWALTGAANRADGQGNAQQGQRDGGIARGAGGGSARQSLGPGRNDRPRDGRGGTSAGSMPPQRASDPQLAQADDEAHDPHELQPPVNMGNPPDTSAGKRRRRGGGNSGAGGDSVQFPPRFGRGETGNFRGSTAGPPQKRRDDRGKGDKASGPAQPDPMKTSFGYIGADTLTRQRQNQAPRRGGGNPGGGTSSSGGGQRGGRNDNRGGNRGGNR